jgi:hypothetical protein
MFAHKEPRGFGLSAIIASESGVYLYSKRDQIPLEVVTDE